MASIRAHVRSQLTPNPTECDRPFDSKIGSKAKSVVGNEHGSLAHIDSSSLVKVSHQTGKFD
jgi:uncharacterized membrane protein